MDTDAASRSRRTRPAKAPLSREAVVRAGLDILRAEGLAAVTMRRVAAELDTGPASLYVYVANSQELHRALLDAVIAEVPRPEPDPARWRDQLVELLTASVRVLDGYPGIARVAIGDVPTGGNGLVMLETMIALLRAGGIEDDVAAWAGDILALYITAVAFERGVMRERTRTPEQQADFHERIHAVFRDLPAERYPNITAVLPALVRGDGEERFRFGLDVLVNGLLATPAPD
jgi:AcrR family transcriptional regulator